MGHGPVPFFMSMKRTTIALGPLICALCFVPVTVEARPEFLSLFNKHYLVSASAPNGDAACRNCHTTPPEWNPYGLAVKDEMQQVGARQLTVAVLQAIEGGDADQDGWLNGDEIRSGFLPGDAESHPDGHPGDPVEPAPGTTEPIGGNVPSPPAPVQAPPVLPLHSFHPAVVHFPVALFLFGALLDVLGFRRGSKSLREAARLNLLAGAAATGLAVPTGVAAFLRLGYPLQHVAVHLALAAGAVVLMVWVALIRRREDPTTGRYWAILTAASVAVGLAGHFGSALVFG